MSLQQKHFYEFGRYRIDAREHLLLRDGEVVPLAPKAFDLLLALVENRGNVLSKEELMTLLWPDSFVEEANLSRQVFTLRKALGEDGESRYVETIPRRGYRFVAGIAEVKDETNELVITDYSQSRVLIDETESRGSTTDFPGSHKPDRLLAFGTKQSTALLALACCGIGLALAVAAFVWITARSRNEQAAPAVKSIAVLPFKPLVPDQRDEALELGMADALIIKLSNIKQIVVRPTSAILKYSDPNQDPLAAGREQGVEALLEGRVQKSANGIRLTVQLVRVSDGTLLWGHEFDDNLGNTFAIQDSISRQVAEALKLRLSGEEQQRLMNRYTNNIEAYQLYLQGRYFWNKRSKEGLERALGYFEQAISKDHNYALAYSGLADSYYILGFKEWRAPEDAFKEAKRAAVAALRIDDNIAEAHTSLAAIKDLYDHDLDGAEQEFKRAIEIDPSYSTARHWYSRHILEIGRVEEALAQARKAQELDPLSLIINFNVGELLYYATRYDESLKQFQKVREMDPAFANVSVTTYHYLTYTRMRMYEEAVLEWSKLMLADDADPQRAARGAATLRESYRVSGERGLWQKQIELVMKEARGHKDSSIALAEIHTRLGEKDKAFFWLKKAAAEHHPSIRFLRVDPDFETLRADSRFADLLRRASQTE
jgi:DNA-binding winged helix-turn-helix (wHTH) protein/TolB-like protein